MSERMLIRGDRVKIIKCGMRKHLSKAMWSHMRHLHNDADQPSHVIDETDDFWIIDEKPALVGKEGQVTVASQLGYFALNVDDFGHVAWFTEDQLEVL